MPTQDSKHWAVQDTKNADATAGVERCGDDNAACLLLVVHELKIGAHYAEGLVYDVAAATLYYDFLFLCALFAASFVLRNLANKWDVDILEVAASAYFLVADFKDEDYDERQEESKCECQHYYWLFHWLDRDVDACWVYKDAVV